MTNGGIRGKYSSVIYSWGSRLVVIKDEWINEVVGLCTKSFITVNRRYYFTPN